MNNIPESPPPSYDEAQRLPSESDNSVYVISENFLDNSFVPNFPPVPWQLDAIQVNRSLDDILNENDVVHFLPNYTICNRRKKVLLEVKEDAKFSCITISDVWGRILLRCEKQANEYTVKDCTRDEIIGTVSVMTSRFNGQKIHGTDYLGQNLFTTGRSNSEWTFHGNDAILGKAENYYASATVSHNPEFAFTRNIATTAMLGSNAKALMLVASFFMFKHSTSVDKTIVWLMMIVFVGIIILTAIAILATQLS